MKYILFFLLTITIALWACSSAKKANTSVIKQGITGFITEAIGNQMPMKGAEPQVGKPVLTNVLIYEPTNLAQVTRIGTSPVYTAIHTKPVASAETDSTGRFTVALPVGSYSIFIQRGKTYYANLFDTINRIALFTVEEDKLTTVNLTISSRASY
jgi:hypothetical protein